MNGPLNVKNQNSYWSLDDLSYGPRSLMTSLEHLMHQIVEDNVVLSVFETYVLDTVSLVTVDICGCCINP